MQVFEPVIGSNLKLTAEEIEMGLIAPNKSNAQLHIVLLKVILLSLLIFVCAHLGACSCIGYLVA